MARPTAYRHQGQVYINRTDGTLLAITPEEAEAVAAIMGAAGAARAAADRHLQRHAAIAQAYPSPGLQGMGDDRVPGAASIADRLG